MKFKRDKNPSLQTGSCKHKVILVDDHPLVCKGLELLIDDEPDLEVAAVAGNAQEAMQILKKTQADLLLLDLSLPGMAGMDLLKNLVDLYPDLPVLVLSMHEENLYAERVLRAGARGYIMKQEPGETVVEAIRCVLSGNIFVSPDMQRHLLQVMVDNGGGKDALGGVESLADRELQVFTLIGEGCSTRAIAKRLSISPKTVQTYREHIKTKLGLKNSIDLTRSAVIWIREGH